MRSWKEVMEFRPYDKPVVGMVDLGTPNNRSSLTQPNVATFSQMEYGFRCDARPPASVLATGFKPLYNINPPDNVQGTIMQRCTTGADGTVQSAGFWIGNRDIVNQTSICAASHAARLWQVPDPVRRWRSLLLRLPLRPAKARLRHRGAPAPHRRPLAAR